MWIEQSWCKHSHVSTFSGGWSGYGYRHGRRTHIREGYVHTELNIFDTNMVRVYS